jgi:tetratricopeptide (TPR) repeat protein
MPKQQKKKLSPAKTTPGRTPAKSAAKKNDKKFQLYVGLAAIILLTLIGFFPSIKNGFINFDDPPLIINNPLIKQLSAINIKRIFSEVYFANYQPLHLFSYMIEYHFFGLNASGYHWVSVILHIINILLVARIAQLISGNNYVTLFTALFFAITPLRMESVAWAAERKDMLYSLFFFAALICYLQYVQKNFRIKYVLLAFLFFTLSVFSKAMAVSLVPVLFLIDFFYGRKFTAKSILEKIPFIALAIVMGLISVHAAKTAGSMDDSTHFTMVDRLFFACQNLLMYISKLIFPYGLSTYYQYPVFENGRMPSSYYISGGIVLVLAVFLFLSLRKTKIIFFSAGFFISTVALVLMIIPVGPTLFSERYSYVPSVMLYFVFMHYLFQWLAKRNSKTLRTTVSVVLILYSLFFAGVLRSRAAIWKDSIAFWSDVIKDNPKNPIAYNNRGNEYKTLGDYKNAISDFNEAIRENQNYAEPIFSLGDTYRLTGEYDSALVYANRALQLKPDLPQGLVNRGIIRAVRNNLDSAMMDFNRCIELNQDMFEAYSNRGNLHAMHGKFDEALSDYNMALKINPDLVEGYINRGRVLKENNKCDLAMPDFNTYLQKGGKNPLVYLMMGECYAAKSDFASAIRLAEQAKANGLPGADDYINHWKK